MIQISIIILVIICLIAKFVSKKETISKIKTHDYLLPIIARLSFSYSRNIDIKNLSKKEQTIISRLLNFCKNAFKLDDDQLEIVLSAFIQLVGDKEFYNRNAAIEGLAEKMSEEDIDVRIFYYENLFQFAIDGEGDFNQQAGDILKNLPKLLKISQNLFRENLEKFYPNTKAPFHQTDFSNVSQENDKKKTLFDYIKE